MGTGRCVWKWVFWAACLALAGGLLACEPEDRGPKAWIDSPIDGASVPVGTPVSVISHAFVKEGVAEVLLSVDGKPFKRGSTSPPGASFGKITQDWLPAEAGEYVLQVRAYDANGEASNPATIKVRVVGQLALEVTDTPTPTSTMSPPDVLDIPSDTPRPPDVVVGPTDTYTPEPPTATWTIPPPDPPTATFTPTPTLTPEPTDTPWPPAQINFRADQTSIEQGNCTTLRWDVEYATAIYLDGDGVAGHDSRQACPQNTQTYTLRVEAAQGGGDRQVTIQVSVPQDTTPPPAPSPAVPANGLTLDCRSTQNLVWMPVDDPSGIEGYYVKLQLQVSKDNWQSAGGWGPVSGKQVEAKVKCGVFYRWAVRARDKAGNDSDWSDWSNFSVEGVA